MTYFEQMEIEKYLKESLGNKPSKKRELKLWD